MSNDFETLHPLTKRMIAVRGWVNADDLALNLTLDADIVPGGYVLTNRSGGSTTKCSGGSDV